MEGLILTISVGGGRGGVVGELRNKTKLHPCSDGLSLAIYFLIKLVDNTNTKVFCPTIPNASGCALG